MALSFLLLDDEQAVARALSLLLQALGHQVLECTEPEYALKQLDSEITFDAFLCDLRMPRFDGLTVLKEAKSRRPALPVILMSGHASSLEVEIARTLGAHDFLMKPFTVDQLKNVLERLETALATQRQEALSGAHVQAEGTDETKEVAPHSLGIDSTAAQAVAASTANESNPVTPSEINALVGSAQSLEDRDVDKESDQRLLSCEALP